MGTEMLPEKREELLQRRGQLQERLKKRADEERLQRFTEPLDQAGVVYSLAEDEPVVAWLNDRFPDRVWDGINWTKVADRQCASENEARNPSAWLSDLAARKGVGDPTISILYANADFPSLRMRYSEAVKHVSTVVDFTWQTWLFDQSSDWVIEFHHDSGWCWGRSA